MTTPFVILASTSPWRLRMLAEAGLPCLAVAPQVDEEAWSGATPVETARLRAAAKAREVASRHPAALVIGADQVLWVEGEAEAIGKPRDEEEWRARLAGLRGRWHHLTTAVQLEAPAALGGAEGFEVHTRVHLRADLTDGELEAYVRWGEARGCAGGYMVEQRGAWLVDALDGDWANVVGLPVLHLVGALRRRGWRFQADGAGAPPAGAGAR